MCNGYWICRTVIIQMLNNKNPWTNRSPINGYYCSLNCQHNDTNLTINV